MSFRLALAPLALIFLVFATKLTVAEPLTGHVIILADLSDSMFDEAPQAIVFQTNGVTAGLRDYVSHCNHIRVTYVPWGTETGDPVVGDLSHTEGLITDIKNVSRVTLGDTRHYVAWWVIEDLYQPGEPTAIIILTNGSGMETVRGPMPQASLFKVAVLSEKALEYLTTQFLPDESKPIYVADVESIAHVVETALRSVDTLCLG